MLSALVALGVLAVACSRGDGSTEPDPDAGGSAGAATFAGSGSSAPIGGSSSTTAGAPSGGGKSPTGGSSSSAGTSSGTGGGVTSDSVPVPKQNPKKIYAHVMPWFETKQSSGTGKWGIHWTMDTQNPDQQDGTGKRQIASHFYPLIGPYASGDADVVEYQLLLMKYAGIDGILMDWPGTLQAFDYAKNLKNAEAMLNRSSAFGLKFAIVYEDQNIKNGGAADARAAGKSDMAYLRDHYFNQPNYVQMNGAPLLLVFGPQTFQAPADWGDLFSVLPKRPAFLTLWGESKEAGEFAAGEYAWVYMDNGKLDDFYGKALGGMKMGSAYPGFHSFYAEGNWGANPFEIPNNGSATFASNLDKALQADGVESVQLTTWNDYGEGTMIEPTRELSYGALTTLQQKLGVAFGQGELELIARLYDQRQAGADSAKLDQASAALNQVRPADAKAILDTL